MRAVCAVYIPLGGEIHISSGARGFIPVENRKKWQLALALVRFNGIEEPILDAPHPRFQRIKPFS
jgi:hypothetical protein